LLSTHIVEDIAQTCQKLAILKSGHVIFQGTIADLLQETQRKVWLITTQGPKPEGNFTIVSMSHQGTAVQYRVVGELSSDTQAVSVEPGLEDGYVWFMQRQNMPATQSSSNLFPI